MIRAGHFRKGETIFLVLTILALAVAAGVLFAVQLREKRAPLVLAPKDPRPGQSQSQPRAIPFAGPFCFKYIDPDQRWISVDWNGKPMDLGMPVTLLNLQLEAIEPRRSGDPTEQRLFNTTFARGVGLLLANRRSFWFQTTNDTYSGPGQLGGVCFLDTPEGPTLQAEMLRRGFAVLRQKETGALGLDRDLRATLQPLEAAAQAEKAGVWAVGK